jgi:hypothetical protein
LLPILEAVLTAACVTKSACREKVAFLALLNTSMISDLLDG